MTASPFFHPRRLLLVASLFAFSPLVFAACSVTTPPPDWASAQWDGECTDDQADGLGVLKELQGAEIKRIFLGRTENGELTLGVVDIPEQGYMAGRFEGGRVVDTDNRQTLLNAFNAGADAAAALAEHFESYGNNGSAQFYRLKERMLREQMD